MKAVCIATMLAITSASPAQQKDATRSFPILCSELQPAAIKWFQHNGLVLFPDPSCPNCFIGKTAHIADTKGHTISTHTALKRYMDTSHDGKDIPGAWHLHIGLDTVAKLKFEPAIQNTCTAHLLFLYSWYATEFLVAVPVDGDPASRPSNLLLEKEYLEAIAQNVPATASH
jgi:hypothetical protein